MKFPLLMNKTLAARTGVFLLCIAAMTVSISAQKLWTASKDLKTSVFAPEATGLDIEQCANGPQSAPIHCDTSAANTGYGRGNLVPSKSHYLEGDFVPIRVVITGITLGSYTVTVGYDFTKGGKFATDYLGNYDYTESVSNNPCVGVTGCVLASRQDFPVTPDPQVANGFDATPMTGDDIAQIAGNISCFGCTITGVSVPTAASPTTGDSSKFVTITFTANQANLVIAYGSHISTRTDWGINNSAINITGSPYHNFISDTTIPDTNQGNRDLQLAADAVIFPAQITIIKCVTTLPSPPDGPGSTSTFIFNFLSASLGNFPLVDNVSGCAGGGTASAVFTGLTAFGAANSYLVQEAAVANWTLLSIVCVETPGGLPNTLNTTTSLPTRTATIILEEGEFVTCTFSNSQATPTAGPVTVSGRVVDSFGRGISGARLTITSAQSGESWSTLSNNFGYYNLNGPIAGGFYMMSVSHRRYTFADGTRTFSLNEDVAGVDFMADGQ
jgi:hypothetical protein